MDIVKICPTCKESITRAALVDILVTYQEDLTESEIYEQGWHKKCYPPAPALLAACEAARHYIGAIPINKIDYRDAEEILDQLAAAIDEAKGSDD